MSNYQSKHTGAAIDAGIDATAKIPAIEQNISSLENDKAEKSSIPTTAVLYTAQTLTEAQKTQARANIGAGTGGGGSAEGAVLYTPQALTDDQRAQANKNLGVANTDIFAVWESGNYNSSGQPVEATVYFVRSLPVDIPDIIITTTPTKNIQNFYYYDENGVFIQRVSGFAIDGQGSIPKVTGATKVAITVYVGGDGGATAEEKVKSAEKIIFRNNAIQIPIDTKQFIRKLESAASPCLKCAQEFNDVESPTLPSRFLWHDESYRFYISDSLKGEKKFAFDWALPETPNEYSMAFYGNDILVVYATAQTRTVQTEDIRRKPYVLVKANNYAPTLVNFPDTKPFPSNWFANHGYWHDSMRPSGGAYYCEYTRPSVLKAYVWKISGTATNHGAWTTVHEHDVAQTESNNGFKHYHGIQKDPYSDWIYFTTGDDDNNSFIYGTKDEFATVELIYGPNREYCRLANFAFTPDYIYWASDEPSQDNHSLFKAVRVGEDKKMDVANAERLYRFDHTSGHENASYCTVYMKTINALVILDREDGGSLHGTPIWVWDLDNGTMHVADTMHSLGGGGYTGFRCCYYTVYPPDNTIAVGYNTTTSIGFNHQNSNRILTNTYANVANLLMNLYRTGTGFGIGFETSR